MKTFLQKNWAGLLLCLAITIPAWFLGKLVPVVGGPVFAILAGMLLTLLLKQKDQIQPGITFTSKKILQAAVVLLGFGMNLTDILQKGKQSLPIILATISTSLLISFLLCKMMKVPTKTGNARGRWLFNLWRLRHRGDRAVLDADDEEIAQSISVIFLFNVIAALIFPTLGGLLGLSNEGFGLFAGTAINDTSSVTAAAQAWDGIHGSNTLDAAAIVKLTRTLAIIPITLVLAFVRTRRERHSAEGAKVNLKKIFPFFVLFFLLASVVTTVFHLPAAVTSPLKEMSKFFIVMAMAAIGLNTNIIKLVKTGGKPIFMGLCCWIGIAGVSLLMQHLLGIW